MTTSDELTLGNDGALDNVGVLDPVGLASPARRLPWSAVRWALAAGAATLFVQSYRSGGFPFDRERVLLWGLVAMLVSCVGRPPQRVLRLVADWAPFAALLYVYALSRGLADGLGLPVQKGSVVRLERLLFFGEVPSTWAQRHLLRTTRDVAPWELGVSVVYASHFVLPLAIPAVLWIRDRRKWLLFAHRFVVLNIIGLTTYVLLPTAPPWMAARLGLIGDLSRPVTRGWRLIGMRAAESLIDYGRLAANPVAAIPSMHAAYPALIVAFFWRSWRWRPLRYVSLLYPLAMAFTLVYGGEHYLVDVYAGWLAAALAFVVSGIGERWWARRGRGGLASEATAPDEADSDAMKSADLPALADVVTSGA